MKKLFSFSAILMLSLVFTKLQAQVYVSAHIGFAQPAVSVVAAAPVPVYAPAPVYYPQPPATLCYTQPGPVCERRVAIPYAQNIVAPGYYRRPIRCYQEWHGRGHGWGHGNHYRAWQQ